MRSIFQVGEIYPSTPPPHPKSLRCATRFRPPHNGEVKQSLNGTRQNGPAFARNGDPFIAKFGAGMKWRVVCARRNSSNGRSENHDAVRRDG